VNETSIAKARRRGGKASKTGIVADKVPVLRPPDRTGGHVRAIFGQAVSGRLNLQAGFAASP